MTYKEFFGELEKLREAEDWFLFEGGQIRCRGGIDCPITAVAKAKGLGTDEMTADDVEDAAKALGLHWKRKLALANAADQDSTEHLRQKMLKAVGLDAGS
jgi:hypothetical protein